MQACSLVQAKRRMLPSGSRSCPRSRRSRVACGRKPPPSSGSYSRDGASWGDDERRRGNIYRSKPELGSEATDARAGAATRFARRKSLPAVRRRCFRKWALTPASTHWFWLDPWHILSNRIRMNPFNARFNDLAACGYSRGLALGRMYLQVRASSGTSSRTVGRGRR